MAMILAAAMLAAVAGCGKGNGETADTGADTSAVNALMSETVSLSSEHYKVTNDMLAYFFYKDFYDAVQMYYDSYYGAIGLELAKDLKAQKYGNSQSTWFDFFMTLTYQNVVKYLTFAEAAIADGGDYSAEVSANVDKEIKQIESAAEEAGESVDDFIEFRFGKDVTMDVIRRANELYYLGTAKYDHLLASLDYDDAAIEKYYEENKTDFLYVDFQMVEVRADNVEYADEAAKEKGYAEARAKAEYIESSANQGEYIARGIDYYKSINDTLEQPMTDDEIEEEVTTVKVQYKYNMNSDFGKWAFADGRQKGDIVMLDNGDGIYTVYYLVSAPYRVGILTKNYRSMSFASEESAQKALAAWENTSKTGEDFENVALDLSDSTGELRKNVKSDSLTQAVGAWLFADGRKSGDCEIVKDGDSYVVLYFDSDGEEQWKYDARQALMSRDITAMFTNFNEKYPVDFDIEKMNLISGENAYTRTAANTKSE